MSWPARICLLSLFASLQARAQTGVILPSGQDTPDLSQLSIDSLHLKISIDGAFATVRWDEVFHNKSGKVLEGNYVLALPGDAAVSNFAVWDDLIRIPGVILERKRAGELYQQIRNEAIDPGLLQSGEISDEESSGQGRHSTQFSVKIVPIPAYGYKRIEAEYRQSLPLNRLQSELNVPLKSATVANFSVDVEVRSPHTVASLKSMGTSYPLAIKQSADEITASFQARDLTLAQDLVLRLVLQNDDKPRVESYREPSGQEPGIFATSQIVQTPSKQAEDNGSRTVTVLFDASLSMQWEKLERSFQALEATLRSLKPADKFNVIVFNSVAEPVYPTSQAASPEAIAKALDAVRATRLRGGTNLRLACTSAFKSPQANSYLVLLSDGGLTEGTISPAQFESWFDKSWKAIPADKQPHIYSLAIGDDANVRLLRALAKHSGVFEQIGSTEPADFKVNAFVSKLNATPLDAIGLEVSSSVEPKLVYRIGEESFPGSRAQWVGQYGKPGEAEFKVTALANHRESHSTTRALLPEADTTHPELPTAWARARVDALLEKIDAQGEDRESIEEIIRLSRKYHFVTPYTSFLAAPRALLRPRLIRPGDPLLRVRTDPSVTSVIALFPFGLTQPLRYLKAEDIWQTRFVAPQDLSDGVKTAKLILRDRQGHVYREDKTFVIASHVPVLRVELASSRVRAGDRLNVRVQASQTTRTISARLYGAAPLTLRWNEAQKSNTGMLEIPPSLPAGRYALHVTAEDFAHNVSRQEVPLEIVP